MPFKFNQLTGRLEPVGDEGRPFSGGSLPQARDTEQTRLESREPPDLVYWVPVLIALLPVLPIALLTVGHLALVKSCKEFWREAGITQSRDKWAYVGRTFLRAALFTVVVLPLVLGVVSGGAASLGYFADIKQFLMTELQKARYLKWEGGFLHSYLSSLPISFKTSVAIIAWAMVSSPLVGLGLLHGKSIAQTVQDDSRRSSLLHEDISIRWLSVALVFGTSLTVAILALLACNTWL